MGLLELIVKTGIADAIASQLDGLKGNRDAIAETIENNVRRKIIEAALYEILQDEAEVERFFVRRMKTKWGSCNHIARSIRLNTELAKKPAECLEYLVLHELVHLLEPTHNARFVALMDRFMPNWQFHRQVLNRLPVRREKWSY